MLLGRMWSMMLMLLFREISDCGEEAENGLDESKQDVHAQT